MNSTLEKVVWTFLQAAIAAVPVEQITTAVTGHHLAALTAVALSALAGGIGAVISWAKNLSYPGSGSTLQRVAVTFAAAAASSISVVALQGAITHASLSGVGTVLVTAIGAGAGAVLSYLKSASVAKVAPATPATPLK